MDFCSEMEKIKQLHLHVRIQNFSAKFITIKLARVKE